MLDQAAPDFSLPATGGQTITLSALKGNKVVLYFYPKDSTPGCTTESQQFRDLHDAFLASGSLVFGISRDGLKSHDNFRAKQELPFHLISDPDETACSVRRHEDEEHVRQAGARHRAQHLRHRRRRRAAP